MKEKHKILVVEDNPEMFKIYRILLERNGYLAFNAFCGKDAIEQAKELLPDLILLDIILGDMAGQEVAIALKNIPETCEIPIIFSSNMIPLEADKGNLAIKIEDKVYKAFAKPIHRNKLPNVIRKAINSRINNNKTEFDSARIIDIHKPIPRE